MLDTFEGHNFNAHQSEGRVSVAKEENSETVPVTVLFYIGSPHPSLNTKPIPQEENPETVFVAVLF